MPSAVTVTTLNASFVSINGTPATDTLNLNNTNIYGVNNISILDPGPNEGISWTGGNSWAIWESPNDLTTNSGGNLQIVQGTTRRATFNTSGQIEIPVATGTAPLSVSSTTLVTNLNADLIDGQQLNTLNANLRSNRALNGGGTITVDSSYNILWSSRFIVINNGNGSHFSTVGYFDINCPTSGTITGVGGASNATATAAGIPLAGWVSLYYILPIGSGATTVNANFRLVGYNSALDIPSDWVLICTRNSDSGYVYFNNGIVLGSNESSAAGLQTASRTNNAVVKRNATGGFSSGSIDLTAGSSSTKGLIIKGATSQTANLTEWQDPTGATILAAMSPSGAFSAVTKSFDIVHPTKKGMRLRYGSLEGPENGVYVRGKSNGVIELPDYWVGLIDPDSITVQLTPIGKHQRLYVKEIIDNKIYVGGSKKEFFYLIQAERNDVEKLMVEYGSGL